MKPVDHLSRVETHLIPGEELCHGADAGDLGPSLQSLITLLEHTDVLIALFDPEDRIRASNAAFREAYFVDRDETPTWAEFMQRNYEAGRGTVVSAPDFSHWLSSAASRRGKVTARSNETDLHDGRWLMMHETVLDSGWQIAIGCDVTSLRASERSLRVDRDVALRASQTDDLTGISNRRHIMGQLETMLGAADVAGHDKGCVCLFDIDHFKRINDTYGHQAGDDVLVAFSTSLRGLVRMTDGFGRMGGEEFMLLMPRTPSEIGRKIVERVLCHVRQMRPLAAHPDMQFTVSGGFAVARACDDVASIYSRCDRSLYAAKEEGRDRIL